MKKIQNVEYSYWKIEVDQVVFEDEFDLIKIESFNRDPKSIRINYSLFEKDIGVEFYSHLFIRNLNVIYQTDDAIYINNYENAEELFGTNVDDNTLVVNFDIETDEDNKWDSAEFDILAAEAVRLKYS